MCAVIICGIRVKDKIPAELFKFLAYFTFFSHFLFSVFFSAIFIIDIAPLYDDVLQTDTLIM